MKAAVYDEADTPEVLRYANVSKPEYGGDEMLDRVETLSIEGGDYFNSVHTQTHNSSYLGSHGYLCQRITTLELFLYKILKIHEGYEKSWFLQRRTSFF